MLDSLERHAHPDTSHGGSGNGGSERLRVLTVTSAWPTPETPRTTIFLKRQVEFLRAAGVDVDVFSFDGQRQPWRYLVACLRLHARLAKGRYDLVHAQFGQNALLAFPKRLPLVVTFRGSDLHGIVGADGRVTLAGRILQRISRLVARHADAVVVVAEHMKSLLPSGIEATVIPSGLDLDHVRPHPRDVARRQLGLPLDDRLVLFAANPAVPRKRHALAKQAVDRVAQSLPVELIVAWGVPHADMPLYMSACDALVLTSVHEGSPNVVKEALACNLPVVSVPTGDVPERLQGVEGCELCPDDRVQTLAAALERVLRRAQRINGRPSVAHLDERVLASRMIGIYRRALPRTRVPRDA
jgi:glycosyltransferase involved in cell wall biosynthesis